MNLEFVSYFEVETPLTKSWNGDLDNSKLSAFDLGDPLLFILGVFNIYLESYFGFVSSLDCHLYLSCILSDFLLRSSFIR